MYFAGRFQCRLATDPDPYDEPFGLRGTACAFPSEPPLDRIIRTSGVAAREGCAPIGVFVTDVSDSQHPVLGLLAGAAVTLEPQTAAEGPFFESWSGINAVPWEEPLSCLDVKIAVAGTTLLRRSHSRRMIKPLALQPTLSRPAFDHLKVVADSVAATDAAELSTRRAFLAERVDSARRPEDRDLALLRLSLVAASDREFGRDAYRLGLCWECPLDGLAVVSDEIGATGVTASSNWLVRLLFTRWDFDSLSGVLVGSLTLPLRS